MGAGRVLKTRTDHPVSTTAYTSMPCAGCQERNKLFREAPASRAPRSSLRAG